jgi:uncharacterized protein (DUF983 family)
MCPICGEFFEDKTDLEDHFDTCFEDSEQHDSDDSDE